MEQTLKSKLLIAILSITISACSADWTENKEQKQFNSKFVSSETTDAQLDQLRFGTNRPPAKDWNGRVVNVYEYEPYTVVKAIYSSQEYELFFFGDESREKVRTLGKDALLTFSGDLGSERSMTGHGARTNAEFKFYPTTLISGSISINIDPALITERVSANQRSGEERDKQRNNQNNSDARDSAIESQVIDFCRESVLEQLKNPASGSFAWFKKEIKKESENKWVYRDVIKSKKLSGAVLPSRFVCTVTVSGEKLSGNARILKKDELE